MNRDDTLRDFPHKAGPNRLNVAKFWQLLDVPLLTELEQLVTIDFDPIKQQVLSGELLFGMATAKALHRDVGFQKTYARYVIYAAHAASVAAQGIANRIVAAKYVSRQEIDRTILKWLQNAVSTGSMTAIEDLRIMYPEHIHEAKQTFRKKGGYNSLTFTTQIGPAGSLGEVSGLTIESALQICQSLDSPDDSLDTQGNCLLHYAAMFGVSDIIEYLVLRQDVCVDIENHQKETPLYKACLAGHGEAVRTLIELHADATIVSEPFGISCLHWLFSFDNNSIGPIARLLISDGKADIDAKVKSIVIERSKHQIPAQHFPFHWPFGTPFHWAIAARSTAAADVLLELGAAIDAYDFPEGDNDRQTALMLAVYRHDAEMVEYLLSKRVDFRMLDSNGRNVLHMMAANHSSLNRAFPLPRSVWSWTTHGSASSHLAQLRSCMLAAHKSGVEVNARRQRSQTPLVDAIENEDACVALVLLEANADPDILCPTGESLLQRWLLVDARRVDYPEMYMPVLEKILQNATNVGHRHSFAGESAYHYIATATCSDEQYEKVMWLLSTFSPAVSIDDQDRYGATPFLKVLSDLNTKNSRARADSLLERGADVELRAHDGEDFLHYLCSNFKLSDQETLEIGTHILARLDASEQSKIACASHSRRDDSTALIQAVRFGKLRCVKLLVELGVDVNKIDMKQRRTALDWAIHVADTRRDMFIERCADMFGRTVQAENGVAFKHFNWAAYPGSLILHRPLQAHQLMRIRYRKRRKPEHRYADLEIPKHIDTRLIHQRNPVFQCTGHY